MKPPFSYYGGKMGLAPRIVELLPPHRVYIEPFAGSLAVLFAKPRSQFEIVNDLDGALVAFWRCLRDRRDELEHVCALTPHARAEFDTADVTADVDELELARRFWVRVNQSFAKTTGTRTGWSITTARSQPVPSTILSRLGRFGAAAERLAEVSIECCDAAGLVERLATPESVIYVDPPYLGSARSAAGGADYRCDMRDDADHERLAAALNATPATVVLSGYHSPLYDRLYANWWTVEHPTKSTSSLSTDGKARTERLEVIWTNRPPAHTLFA